MADLQKLTDERATLIESARAVVKKSEAEGRKALNSEEKAEFERYMNAADELRASIETEKRIAAAEKEMNSVSAEDRAVSMKKEKAAGAPSDKDEERKIELFRAWITEGQQGVANHESRDLAGSVLTSGGSFIPPLQWINRLIKAVDNLVFMRQLATTFQLTGAHSLGAPSLDADPSDPSWTSEVPAADPTADSTMKTGGREFKPSPLIKLIKVSKSLLRNSVIPVEQLVLDRLAYKFAVAEENAYLNGTGANQPLGLFTASDQGIPTSRDVATDNEATTPTFDGLINAKYSLKAQYWAGSSWIFHQDCQKLLVKIRDGDGNYMWRNSVTAGEPDTLLNLPVRLSQYAPNTFTTGLYVGVVGDYSNYWIADSLALDVQRLLETYALRRQVGFVADKETDGMPVLSEAFARVKLG